MKFFTIFFVFICGAATERICPIKVGFELQCLPVYNSRSTCLDLPKFVIDDVSPCSVDFDMTKYPITRPCKISYMCNYVENVSTTTPSSMPITPTPKPLPTSTPKPMPKTSGLGGWDIAGICLACLASIFITGCVLFKCFYPEEFKLTLEWLKIARFFYSQLDDRRTKDGVVALANTVIETMDKIDDIV